MAYGELEVFANVWVKTYDVNVLNSLIITRLVVKARGLGSTSVKCVSRLQGTLFHNGMST